VRRTPPPKFLGSAPLGVQDNSLIYALSIRSPLCLQGVNMQNSCFVIQGMNFGYPLPKSNDKKIHHLENFSVAINKSVFLQFSLRPGYIACQIWHVERQSLCMQL